MAPRVDVSRQLTRWLARLSYTSLVVRDFSTGRAEMQVGPPDVFISEVRLGAYNGLHLAVHIRSRGWDIPALLIGNEDQSLRREAERLRCAYLTLPLDERALLAAIPSPATDVRPLRRAPRTRLEPLDALIDELPARVIEVSYEGVRLELPSTAGNAVPAQFVVRIPALNLSCRADRVWMAVSSAEGTSCGATVQPEDAACAAAWRGLVDSISAVAVITQ